MHKITKLPDSLKPSLTSKICGFKEIGNEGEEQNRNDGVEKDDRDSKK